MDTHIHKTISIYIYGYTSTSTCENLHLHLRPHLQMSTSTSTNVYVYIHIHIHIYIPHIHTHINVHIHVHVHGSNHHIKEQHACDARCSKRLLQAHAGTCGRNNGQKSNLQGNIDALRTLWGVVLAGSPTPPHVLTTFSQRPLRIPNSVTPGRAPR